MPKPLSSRFPPAPVRRLPRFPYFLILVFAAMAPSVSALDHEHSDPMDGNVPGTLRIWDTDSLKTAVFAGGSFWCLEPVFASLPGVDSVTSGYTGGTDGNGSRPDFETVAAGNTGFVEAVRGVYRPKRIAYAKLLDAYWRNIDPTRADGQFTDLGAQFRPVVFYQDDLQSQAAEASRKRLEKSKRFTKPIVAAIEPTSPFFPAEAEHQHFYRRNAPRYQTYLRFSGREAFLRRAWGTKVPAK